MRNCCAANQFSGCCEDGECNSATRPIIQILDRPIRTVTAKGWASRFVTGVLIAFYMAVAIGCGITLDNHFKREALINQENVTWNR
jgi:hypothetical protein